MFNKNILILNKFGNTQILSQKFILVLKLSW